MRVVFEPEDWKSLEDTLARALVRAARSLARDGFFPWMAPRTAQAADVAPAEEPPAAVPVPEPPAPVMTAPTPAPAPPPAKAKRRSIRDYIRAVEFRPDGYADIDDVAAALFGKNATDAHKTMIRLWVANQEVKALIVTSAKPPNKGLPGRLMVERQSARERDALRLRNASLAPIERLAVPKVNEPPPPRRGAPAFNGMPAQV